MGFEKPVQVHAPWTPPFQMSIGVRSWCLLGSPVPDTHPLESGIHGASRRLQGLSSRSGKPLLKILERPRADTDELKEPDSRFCGGELWSKFVWRPSIGSAIQIKAQWNKGGGQANRWFLL